MRRTKIVCTLGPASESVEMMRELAIAGLDAARLNFSHGTYESHGMLIKNLKQVRDELKKHIPLILDTKGPEIRIKKFEKDRIYLENGADFTLTTEDVIGNESIVSVTYKDLPKDLNCSSRLLLDDGLIELKVVELTDKEVRCKVVNGGFLSSNKGINIPDVYVNLPSLTERDIEDIKFGIKMDVDYIAASFIRSANDVNNIRKVLKENNGGGILIISKIENREGVLNIDEIIEASDGIMVARGDLGVEIPPEEVPLVQKELIKKANEAGKPVITATQMLESMVRNPRPTRAEVNDVANAIFDGSDAIMLSGETASGAHPVEAVKMMARISEKIEESIDYFERMLKSYKPKREGITNAISYAACTTAAELMVPCIAAVTKSGFTVRMIAKFKPVCPIAATSYDIRVCRQMNLLWGVVPVYTEEEKFKDMVFNIAVDCARRSGLAKAGDSVVIAVGVPLGVSGTTNTLRVEIA